MAEAAAEIVIVICTLLLGDLVIWFNERRRKIDERADKGKE